MGGDDYGRGMHHYTHVHIYTMQQHIMCAEYACSMCVCVIEEPWSEFRRVWSWQQWDSQTQHSALHRAPSHDPPHYTLHTHTEPSDTA